MASVSSVSNGGSTSSIYGNRNVLTGMASGLDTESMIENAVSGYQSKITRLQQQRTKLEWKQDAYRDIITSMYSMSNKYMSYSSATNLLSSSFFTSSRSTTAIGAFAGAVDAAGKTDSSVALNRIKSLATAATYTSNGARLTTSGAAGTITADNAFSLDAQTRVSNINGTLNLSYGGKDLFLMFSESDTFENADELASAINEKLADEMLSMDSGKTYKASERIRAVAEDGVIRFEDLSNAGNTVKIGYCGGNLKAVLETQNGDTTLNVGDKALYKTVNNSEYLSGKEMRFTLNGTSKTIKLGEYNSNEAMIEDIQGKLDAAFGAGKITVANEDGAGGVQLSFGVGAENQLKVNSDVGEMLGLGKTATSYFATSKTLGQLGLLDGLTAEGEFLADGSENKNAGKYAFTLNGTQIGYYDKDTTVETILKDMSAKGFKASYSAFSDQFKIEANETGASSKLEFGEGLASKLFGDGTGSVRDGTDAVFTATVNGVTKEYSRSTNTVDIDGLSLTMKAAFGYDEAGNVDGTVEAVTFNTEAKTDDIVSAVKSFVEDYNAMVKSIKDAYTTQPAEKSSKKHTRYEPLTEKDMEDMSESAIEKYEAKAKQGILFGDSDLSSLYEGLRSAASGSALDLSKIGITTAYSGGLTTLKLDESKLASALKSDADAVAKVFAGDSQSAGVMTKFKTTLDAYGATTGATKGILVQKAGARESSLSQLSNTLLKQMGEIDEDIQKWEVKLASKVDYYTNMFSKFEQLVNTMNSQSGLLGQMSGY